jgi:hypothetical protein
MNQTPALITVTLTPQHVQRLRALLTEEFARIEQCRRNVTVRAVGYHSTLDDIRDDFGDVYEQLVLASKGAM